MNRIKRAEGQGLVEYALLLVLVAIIVIAILALMGDQVRSVFARVVAGLNGQTISGSGTEYAITGFGVSVGPGTTNCPVTATGVQVAVFEDGLLVEGASVGGVTAVATSGNPSPAGSGTTDANGIAAIGNLTSTGAACSGTLEVSVGGSSSSVSYSQ